MNDINKHGTKWSPRPIIVTKYAKTADFGPNILILIEWVLKMKMIKYIKFAQNQCEIRMDQVHCLVTMK